MTSPTPTLVPLGGAIELPLPLPGRRNGALSVAFATGLPSARERPGWEVPTPGSVFPWAPKESEVLLGL